MSNAYPTLTFGGEASLAYQRALTALEGITVDLSYDGPAGGYPTTGVVSHVDDDGDLVVHEADECGAAIPNVTVAIPVAALEGISVV